MRKAKIKIDNSPLANKLRNRIGYGKTTLLHFHNCICGHQDISHIEGKYECIFCINNCFIKCKDFRPDIFELLIVFDVEKKTSII